MKKTFTAAALVALSALGAVTLAHAEVDSDPLTYQLNRWGVPATPENIARYQFENRGALLGSPGVPYFVPGASAVFNQGVPLNNWPSFGLAAPPAGYQWWQVGNRIVLANQVTGAIAQVLSVR